MLIYDKRDTKIDIFSFEANKNKIKEYKKKIIDSVDINELFYRLTVKGPYIKSQIMSKDDLLNPLYFSNGVIIGKDEALWIVPMNKTSSYDYKKQKAIIEKYIEGEYDDLNVRTVIEKCIENGSLYRNYGLLIVEDCITKRITISTYREVLSEYNNVVNLPEQLHLLYLLQHGEYKRLVSKDILEQLSLFDIEYLKSVSIMDIKDMTETGLVSATLFDAVKKAEVGSKILQKRKK